MPEEFLLRLQTRAAYLPFELTTPKNAAFAFIFLFGIICFRYFLSVGGFYYFFWRGFLSDGQFKKLHKLNPPAGQISSEIKWSLVSSLLFAAFALLMGIAWQNNITLIYTDFGKHGIWYLPLSFLILSLIHEIYFYWTHVWMHRPSLFKKMHAVHHQSVNTSPWASFSFHPWEAVVHAVFLPLAVFILPLHPVVIIAYLSFMTLTAISNHLGMELIGSDRIKSFFISGTHHSAHHRNMRKNFGLYYTFSDKVFGTEEIKVE